MNKIRNNIFLGSWQPAENLEELKANGITAVLNVALDHNDTDFFNDGIFNVKVGLGDCNYNDPKRKEFAVNTLEKLIDMGEIVFVHCVSGASRSPYVVGKYLSRKENRSLQDVMNELHQLRPEVFEHGVMFDE